MAEETIKKKSGFKKFTEKYAQLWQLIKFTLASMVAGISEYATYMILGMLVLTPLAAQGFHWWIFNYDAGSSSGLCDMIAYLVSTTVGNMVSFVINRKKTFKSATNVTFSVTATLIMIAFIICCSTYLGPVFTTMVTGWFKNATLGNPTLKEFICKTIGKTLICMFTFFFVFIMDKLVILREPHKTKEQKALEKKAAEEESMLPTKKVVNNALAKKFLIFAVILAVVSVAAIIIGRMSTVTWLLISGSILVGIAYILIVAFAVEKIGDKVPIKPDEAGTESAEKAVAEE